MKTEKINQFLLKKVIEDGSYYSENRKVIVPAQPKREKITQYTGFKESYFRDSVYHVGLLNNFFNHVLGMGISGPQNHNIYVNCFDATIYR
ncbi:MAG: hypothetical protein ACK5M7_06300, partial [Draconibacterium sp.]